MNNGINILIFILAFFVVSTNINCAENNNKVFDVKLEANKSEYFYGEPLALNLIIKNVSREDYYINWDDLGLEKGFLHLVVRNSKGFVVSNDVAALITHKKGNGKIDGLWTMCKANTSIIKNYEIKYVVNRSKEKDNEIAPLPDEYRMKILAGVLCFSKNQNDDNISREKFKTDEIRIRVLEGADKVNKTITEEPSEKEITNEMSVIKLNEKTYDFGTVNQGAKILHEFVLKNSDAKSIEIDRVKTSCGCTEAKLSKYILNPSDETKIEVEFDTSGKEGKQEQKIVVYFKGTNGGTVELFLRGNVKKKD